MRFGDFRETRALTSEVIKAPYPLPIAINQIPTYQKTIASRYKEAACRNESNIMSNMKRSFSGDQVGFMEKLPWSSFSLRLMPMLR